MKKFRCRRCGKCCSHIRSQNTEDEDFLREYAYGKLPLIQLLPVDKTSFPLWDFEAKRFKMWQRDVNIDAKIEPSRAIFDLKRNKSIIVTYYMDYDACPFLKDGLCLIYDKKRAFICRSFPFNKGPFLNIGEEIEKEKFFGSCPALKEILPSLDDKDKIKFVKQLYETFGEEFLNIVEFDYLQEWTNRMIIKLIKERVIRPAIGYPYKYLLKRIKNSEKIDFTDFLIEEKIKTKQEINELIERLDNNTDAKEKIKNFLEQPTE